MRFPDAERRMPSFLPFYIPFLGQQFLYHPRLGLDSSIWMVMRFLVSVTITKVGIMLLEWCDCTTVRYFIPMLHKSSEKTTMGSQSSPTSRQFSRNGGGRKKRVATEYRLQQGPRDLLCSRASLSCELSNIKDPLRTKSNGHSVRQIPFRGHQSHKSSHGRAYEKITRLYGWEQRAFKSWTS